MRSFVSGSCREQCPHCTGACVTRNVVCCGHYQKPRSTQRRDGATTVSAFTIIRPETWIYLYVLLLSQITPLTYFPWKAALRRCRGTPWVNYSPPVQYPRPRGNKLCDWHLNIIHLSLPVVFYYAGTSSKEERLFATETQLEMSFTRNATREKVSSKRTLLGRVTRKPASCSYQGRGSLLFLFHEVPTVSLKLKYVYR